MTNDQIPRSSDLGLRTSDLGLESWPLAGSGIINPWAGVAMWRTTGEIVVEDTMRRVISGTLNGALEPGLYSGGIHWIKPALADLDNDADLDLFDL